MAGGVNDQSGYDGAPRESAVSESADDVNATNIEAPEGGPKKRRRRLVNPTNNPRTITAAQASSFVYHGAATLAPHKRNRKNVYCQILHPRVVNFDMPIFYLESKSCESRKQLLREEVRLLTADLDSIVALLHKNNKTVDLHGNESGTGEGGKVGGRQRVVQTVMAVAPDGGGGASAKVGKGSSRGSGGTQVRSIIVKRMKFCCDVRIVRIWCDIMSISPCRDRARERQWRVLMTQKQAMRLAGSLR